MPIIERKALDNLTPDDILYLDAGNLIKAGQKVGNNVQVLANYNLTHITTVSLTREEIARHTGDDADKFLQDFIEKSRSHNYSDLKLSLKNNLMDLHVPFSEKDQSFSIPGKRNFLNDNDLLRKKLEPLNLNHVQAGSSRIIDKYKLKFTGDLLAKYQSFYDGLKPAEKGSQKTKDTIGRLHVNSIRLNSWYDETRLRTVGDSLVNQSIDIAMLFMHTFININKKRIIEGRPLSESRWDPTQKKTDRGVYQYKPELILEAAIGALLHNVGNAHHTVHKTVSGKPQLSADVKSDQHKIKNIQNAVNVLKHLFDRDDISSISKMICLLQKDYPDGTGFPAPNENKYLFEFVRLFQIVAFYDNMTNPVISRTAFSRMDVINYIIRNSGEYNYTGDKFKSQQKFDSALVREFLDVLAPYDINEKVYLYQKGRRDTHLFTGRVVSYSDSYIPLISILKDEKNNKLYRDGSLLMHIPSSSLIMRSKDKTERKQYPWVGELEIFDRMISSGDISMYSDPISGEVRPLHKSIG